MAASTAALTARPRPARGRAARGALRAPCARWTSSGAATRSAASDLHVRPAGLPRLAASWCSTSDRARGAAAARARRVPRAHPLRAAAEPLPGALARQRAAELPGALGARPGASGPRAEPCRAGGVALGGPAEGVRYAGARSHAWDTAFARARSSAPADAAARGRAAAAPTASCIRAAHGGAARAGAATRPDRGRLVLLRRRASLAGERLHRRGGERDPAHDERRADRPGRADPARAAARGRRASSWRARTPTAASAPTSARRGSRLARGAQPVGDVPATA